ncbi:iron permease [Bifidobacterium eulemuris]|uniref:Iron permease n=2 Tax=Bifidobacterium eulemuris TaxID=1765219 RepID=A0A261GDJ5_9BIFI|nr:iron permease [Bifidobacterium eulemuris]QOL32163.1 FTR1 family iron permease [Bifidobacterium eulemuris]
MSARMATASRGTGRATAKLGAWLALLVAALMMAAMMAPVTAHADEDDADYDSWSAIADAIDERLAEGAQTYQDGDRAGAAADFSAALNAIYVASNFATVTNDTIGAETYQSQTQQFRSIQQLAYKQGSEAEIETQTAALSAELDATAATLDANADLAAPRDYAKAREEKTKAEREVLDANKVNKNTGRGDRSWSDVAAEMVEILDQALEDSKTDGTKGSDGVNNAYYQYYEKLGFEKNVMNAIGGDRVSKVESTFKNARKAMVKGEDATQYIEELSAMLVEDGAELDGGAGDNVSGFTKWVTSSIGQAFLILVREGLEALLVVAAIIAYLVKSGNKRFTKWIYLGVVVGLIGSGIVAVVFMLLFGGSGPVQETMEGVCALIAMCMLLWTSNWMLNKSSVEAWNRYIRTKTESAVAAANTTVGAAEKTTLGTVVSLAMLSFLAVFREGAETVIFYQSIYSMTQDSQGMWIGGIAAAVVLVIVFVIIRFTSVRIPIGPFFLVTSILMSILVVIFAGGGVHSLIEGDVLSGIYLEGVPTNDWLGFYPYVETLVAQALAAVAVIALFVVGFVKQRRAKAALDKTAA